MRSACLRVLLACLAAFLTLACGGGSNAPAPPPAHAVTYAANGANSGSVPVDPGQYVAGSTVTVLGNTGSLARAAYTFSGWCLRPDGTGTSYIQGQTFTMGQADVTLYARWTLNPTYHVTYDPNGATGGTVPADSSAYEQDWTVTVAGNSGSLTRAGYAFAGWCLRPDGTGTSYTQGQTFIMGQADVTLYAKWTLNPTYHVAYHPNGATGGIAPVDTSAYEQGWTVTVPGNAGNLARTGYTFAGWCTLADGTGTTYTQGQTFTMGQADVTLYAKWTPNPTYTVTYDGNGNTGGSVPVDSTAYEQGWSVLVPGNTGNLARSGFTFAGWCTRADGTGAIYTQGQSFTMGATDLTLYARWTPNPTYAVTYDGNGSTGGSVPVDTGRYETDTTITVLDNTQNLTKVVGGIAQVFGGWNTQADAHGTTYAPGQTFTMGTVDVVLYALWLPPYVLPTTTTEVSLGASSTLVDGTRAYVVAGTQFKVLDLTDPLNPAVLGTLTHGFTDLRVEVHAIHNNIVWLARSWSGGMGQATYISGIDVSNPAAPAAAGTLMFQSTSSLLSSVSRIHNGYLLVHDYSRNVVYVVDIANPATPSVYAQWSVPNMVSGGPGLPHIEGNLFYLPCGENRTLRIYDLTNLASVTQVGVVSTSEECYGPAAKVGAFVYVTTRTQIMDALDVSNPASPVKVGSVPATGYPKVWKGRLFTFRDSPSTITAYDLANPASPAVQASSAIPLPAPSTALGLYPLAYPSAAWIGDYLVGQTYGSATAYHATRALYFPVN